MSDSMGSLFLDGSEHLIRRFGMYRIAAAIGGVVAILVALGALTTSIATAIAIAVGFVAWLFLLVLALYIDRREVYSQLSTQGGILTRYAESIDALQDAADYFDLISWDERVYVAGSGTVTIERRFTLRVGARPMPAFWSKTLMDPPHPKGTKYRKHVHVYAAMFDSDDNLGVAIPHTSQWDEHSLTVYMHLLQHEAPGATVRIFLRIVWPGYYEHLALENTVPNDWTFRRNVEDFTVSIELDKKFLRERQVRVSALPGGTTPTLDVSGSCTTVKYAAQNPPRNTQLGFNLQLAKS